MDALARLAGVLRALTILGHGFSTSSLRLVYQDGARVGGVGVQVLEAPVFFVRQKALHASHGCGPWTGRVRGQDDRPRAVHLVRW